ncbi:MAG: hypothetical protein ACW975_07695, partial [Candidatus Thorarchaeota archaeon]
AYDEASYISTDGIILALNPPLVPRLVRLLTMIMAEERANEIARQFVRAWRKFGTHQESLEQWL